MRRVRFNRRRGVALAESAASMTLLLPLLVMIMFVALEASQAYLIKSNLSEAAREAARDLSIAYGMDPTIASNRGSQNSQVFDQIRIHNIVNSSNQFDDPVFSSSSTPPTVSVTVRYASNQYGLPAFPNPDPLKIASSLNIVGTSSYRLQ